MRDNAKFTTWLDRHVAEIAKLECSNAQPTLSEMIRCASLFYKKLFKKSDEILSINSLNMDDKILFRSYYSLSWAVLRHICPTYFVEKYTRTAVQLDKELLDMFIHTDPSHLAMNEIFDILRTYDSWYIDIPIVKISDNEVSESIFIECVNDDARVITITVPFHDPIDDGPYSVPIRSKYYQIFIDDHLINSNLTIGAERAILHLVTMAAVYFLYHHSAETHQAIPRVDAKKRAVAKMRPEKQQRLLATGSLFNVIRMRAAKPCGADGSQSPTGQSWKLNVRHLVRGHLRKQACGPKHSERKITWVKPHYRGPENPEFTPKPNLYIPPPAGGPGSE